MAYVETHFLMYTRILQLFLARGTAFDWYSLSRPTVPTATTKGSKLLELTERVMTLALDARFLEVLKGVETSLSGSGTSVMKTSASSARLASSPRIGIEGYKYRNVSNIRNGIVTWEDTFVYTPVFEEGKVGGVQGRFVGAVWEGRERLLQWKEKKIEEEEENTGSYFGWGKEKKNTQDQYSVIDKTLKKLEAIVDRVTKVWELPNPALAVPLRRSMSDITGGIDDEGIVKEWAPGVAEPQRSGNVLTLRGRNQVKQYLLMVGQNGTQEKHG